MINWLSTGLHADTAKARLEEYGPNVLSYKSAAPWWLILWNAFFHPFNIILLALATISGITGDMSTLSIMIAMVVISVTLRFWQVNMSTLSLYSLLHHEFTVYVDTCFWFGFLTIVPETFIIIPLTSCDMNLSVYEFMRHWR